MQQRQTHSESRTFVRSFRVSLDRSAMKLDQLLHQCETDAESAMTPAVAAVGLAKHLKHVRQKSGIYSLPCIGDDQHRASILILQTDIDAPTVRRKLHRVIQQVPGDLLQPQTVAIDEQKLIVAEQTDVDASTR